VIGFPPIEQQIAAMRQRWPTFRASRVSERTALWQGPVRPLLTTYEISIRYRAPLVVERLDPMRQQPNVRIVAPPLKLRARELPHVYWDREGYPVLCLFDPSACEWTPCDLLAETTVPWTIDWLACYEGWRATGEWTGGGRHLPPDSQGCAA
jgi:hypothetical protein